MEYRIENKKLYLAKKLLEYWNNRPDLILSLNLLDREDDELTQHTRLYRVISIKADQLQQCFPDLTKKEVHETLLSLEEQQVVVYKKLELRHEINYEELQSFNIRPLESALKTFIFIAQTGLFELPLSDEGYYRETLGVLEALINSDTSIIKLAEFHQKNAYDVLKGISNYSDAIIIKKELNQAHAIWVGVDGNLASDGLIYSPNSIEIINKPELTIILIQIKAIVDKIYIKGIDLFIEKNKELNWKCKECKEPLGIYRSPQEMRHWLDIFASGGYKTCPNRRERNVFSIDTEGKITYSILTK